MAGAASGSVSVSGVVTTVISTPSQPAPMPAPTAPTPAAPTPTPAASTAAAKAESESEAARESKYQATVQKFLRSSTGHFDDVDRLPTSNDCVFNLYRPRLKTLKIAQRDVLSTTSAKRDTFDALLMGWQPQSQSAGDGGSGGGGSGGGKTGNSILGASVWPSALVLGRYLEHHSASVVRGRSVLELGSGTGIGAMIAHALGAACVVASDQRPLLPLIEYNIMKNFRSTTTTTPVTSNPDTTTTASGDGKSAVTVTVTVSPSAATATGTGASNSIPVALSSSLTIRAAELNWGCDHPLFHDPNTLFDLIIGSDLLYDSSVFPYLIATLLLASDHYTHCQRSTAAAAAPPTAPSTAAPKPTSSTASPLVHASGSLPILLFYPAARFAAPYFFAAIQNVFHAVHITSDQLDSINARDDVPPTHEHRDSLCGVWLFKCVDVNASQWIKTHLTTNTNTTPATATATATATTAAAAPPPPPAPTAASSEAPLIVQALAAIAIEADD